MITPFRVSIGDSFLMFLLIPSEQIEQELAALETKLKVVIDHTYRTIELIS